MNTCFTFSSISFFLLYFGFLYALSVFIFFISRMFGWTSSKCVCVFKRPWKKNETSTYWSPKTNTQRKRNVYFFLLRVSFLFIWFTSYWSLSIGNILFLISINEFVVSSCSDHRPHAKSDLVHKLCRLANYLSFNWMVIRRLGDIYADWMDFRVPATNGQMTPN